MNRLATIAARAAKEQSPFLVAGGHPRRVVKDADDVIRLVEANHLNMNDPRVRELVLKHGTPNLYEKTRRICSAD